MSTSAEEISNPGGTFSRGVSVAAAGVICGFLAIVLSIGNGSLVFATNLTSYLPFSLGLALFSTSVATVVISLSSSARSTIATVQEVPCVALGVLVGATAQHLSPNISEAGAFVTVMVSIGCGTLATGVGVFLMGTGRLGEIVRFIPYPVVGGFLAGTGWLIFLGGIGIVLAEPATIDIVLRLPDTDAGVRFALAMMFIAVLVLARRQSSSPLVLPAVILTALILFNVAVQFSGLSHETLEGRGWLFQFPHDAKMWPAVDLIDIASVEWWPIAMGMLYAPVVIVLTAIALLLNATGIELERSEDIDLNRDLRSVGAGNALVGFGGGLPGFHSLSLTLIASRLGANSRWVGIITAIIVMTALVFGPIVLDTVPPFILGAMLIWMGGSLVVDWVAKSFGRISLWDYILVVLILAIVIVFGFGIGIGFGIVASVFLFAVQYARIDSVRNELTGRDYQSRVDGSPQRQELLNRYGDNILIIRLQGYLFFGTANRLRRRLQERLSHDLTEDDGYLVIDFQRVTGLDSSAISSFARLQQVATKHSVTMILTGLADTVRLAFPRNDGAVPIRMESDLERGLKWCEDAILARHAADHAVDTSRPISSILIDIVGDNVSAETIRNYCERIVAKAGTKLIEEGALAEDIYFVESGLASVRVAGNGAAPVHLATVSAGAVVGEVAFYLAEKRSASVVVEDEMIAWRLSRSAMHRLQTEIPEVGLRFHQGMATALSKRLIRTNRLVSFLAD